MDSLVTMATTVGSVGRRGVAFSTTGRARRLRSVAASMLSGGRTWCWSRCVWARMGSICSDVPTSPHGGQ